MKTLVPYIKIARFSNVLMTGAAVALGSWLGHSTIPAPGLFLLIIAGIFTASFGNVINDLHDIAADRVNRRDRPLPKNEMPRNSARIFAAYLAVTALGSAAFVSPFYLAWTALPILILICYTRFLKGTPLAGNITVSLLVAYAIVYGALGAPDFKVLAVPAALAFLLNLVREIIKDLQDEPGDRAAGTVTTASLPRQGIKTIIYLSIGTFLLLLYTPRVFGHFGAVYTTLCTALILPLQLVWLLIFARKNWLNRLYSLSLLIKAEMIIGLLALAADRFLYT